jgi:hypothetical protein
VSDLTEIAEQIRKIAAARDDLLIGIAEGIELLLRQSHNDTKAHHAAEIIGAMRKKFTDSR